MNPDVEAKLSGYPARARTQLLGIRKMILDVAESENLGTVQETLKWGEPSYAVKGGSPIRMDWKEGRADKICLYVNCNTRLIETYRELYSDCLKYEGKRAVVLGLDEALPKEILKNCISMALNYHKIKHLPLLGH